MLSRINIVRVYGYGDGEALLLVKHHQLSLSLSLASSCSLQIIHVRAHVLLGVLGDPPGSFRVGSLGDGSICREIENARETCFRKSREEKKFASRFSLVNLLLRNCEGCLEIRYVSLLARRSNLYASMNFLLTAIHPARWLWNLFFFFFQL